MILAVVIRNTGLQMLMNLATIIINLEEKVISIVHVQL